MGELAESMVQHREVQQGIRQHRHVGPGRRAARPRARVAEGVIEVAVEAVHSTFELTVPQTAQEAQVMHLSQGLGEVALGERLEVLPDHDSGPEFSCMYMNRHHVCTATHV